MENEPSYEVKEFISLLSQTNEVDHSIFLLPWCQVINVLAEIGQWDRQLQELQEQWGFKWKE